MPLVDSNQASLWDGGASSLYRCEINGQTVGFTRAAYQQYFGNDPWYLIQALQSKGLQKGQRIALVGAGFGWVAEQFVANGYGPMADGTANGKVCAVDTSTWIQANKAANAVVSIINADVNAATGRRTIRQQFGSNNATIDWVITEDVLPILSDSECLVLCTALRGLTTNVAHWVSEGVRFWNNPAQWAGDSRLNWHTMQEWKTLVTPDIVIRRGASVVVL